MDAWEGFTKGDYEQGSRLRCPSTVLEQRPDTPHHTRAHVTVSHQGTRPLFLLTGSAARSASYASFLLKRGESCVCVCVCVLALGISLYKQKNKMTQCFKASTQPLHSVYSL